MGIPLAAPAGRWRNAFHPCGWVLLLGLASEIGSAPAWGQNSEAIVKSEFIVANPLQRMCHSSTIVETRAGLVAAWVGGSGRGTPDASIYLSRYDGAKWLDPVMVADGSEPAKQLQYPCWNPVLFRPSYGPLYLFYKVGPSPASWWGMAMRSHDEGANWSKPHRLPPDIFGPIRNKPVELADGTLLCGSSSEDAGWRVHMERTRNPFGEWSRTGALNSVLVYRAIQPTILAHAPNRIQILCRTKQGIISQCWSGDGGYTWTRMSDTSLPNPNSAIDSIVLRNGLCLLVYNHSATDRGVLNVALSSDGELWKEGLVLENKPGDEYSYPAVIQASDGLVHVTYSWNRQKIKHVVIDPFKLTPGADIINGQWP